MCACLGVMFALEDECHGAKRTIGSEVRFGGPPALSQYMCTACMCLFQRALLYFIFESVWSTCPIKPATLIWAWRNNVILVGVRRYTMALQPQIHHPAHCDTSQWIPSKCTGWDVAGGDGSREKKENIHKKWTVRQQEGVGGGFLTCSPSNDCLEGISECEDHSVLTLAKSPHSDWAKNSNRCTCTHTRAHAAAHHYYLSSGCGLNVTQRNICSCTRRSHVRFRSVKCRHSCLLLIIKLFARVQIAQYYYQLT